MKVLPENLQPYMRLMRFMLKYWNSSLLEYATSQALDKEDGPTAKQSFDQSPEELVLDLKNMGSTYVKLGQLLSTRPDLLPKSYLRALADLQDNVESIEFEGIKEIIEQELKADPYTIFKAIDEQPLASASIGQVHKAVLYSGEVVAIKVQRPGIEEQFIEDIKTLENIIDFAVKHSEITRKYAFKDILQELQQVLFKELNYHIEANNLITLHQNLINYENITVPLPYLDFSSKRVLTMQFIDGKKITSVPVYAMRPDSKELAHELVSAYLQQILKDGFVHADPHPGNVHYTFNRQIALIDLGMVANISKSMQEYLIQLLLALTNREALDAAEILISISTLNKDTEIGQFKKDIIHLIVNYHNTSKEELGLGKLLIQLNRIAAEHHMKLPPEINILGKVLLNLEQIIAHLDPQYDYYNGIERNLIKILKDNIKDDFKAEKLISFFIEGKRLLRFLPKRMNEVFKHFAKNDFKVTIDAIDEKRITDGFQKVANRITLGLILASMILGASILMQVPSKFTIFGYPGLAIIFFLLSAIGGIILSFIIIFKDEN
ncbi:ABC1 family protein [Galbibacter marinus]|uniref:ABC1 family protein n=1 Tax=Galbibacter marinus TaxID=555500 RepID=K2PV06_9FLAO|nr:AarF/UbiB family protein [Galbibacter marinus]EKF56520.1 ABC1 family protein [Galbibacter marinus]